MCNGTNATTLEISHQSYFDQSESDQQRVAGLATTPSKHVTVDLRGTDTIAHASQNASLSSCSDNPSTKPPSRPAPPVPAAQKISVFARAKQLVGTAGNLIGAAIGTVGSGLKTFWQRVLGYITAASRAVVEGACWAKKQVVSCVAPLDAKPAPNAGDAPEGAGSNAP